jgi:large subunit ribosomal protein L4
MKIQVKNFENKKVREIELPDEVFGYEYKEHLIHAAVQAHLGALRSGTHKAKGRSEVKGSGRKLYRQKGTGRARVGNARSPIRRGGGAAHGPRPRSYVQGLTPREKRNALKSALSHKVMEERLFVIDSLVLDNHKTGSLSERLGGLGIDGKALLVDSYDNENLKLASRNNPRLKAVDALGVSVYDVVDRAHFVVSEDALVRMVEVLSK